ncbi:MAG: adenylyltransferase/cytidyltransferase family protein [Candidatus Pacebacteria bacterium]|nr:adenylyltransferase/cytidyltransferase family protein [Candidatus Paceibacterota bacterium]MBP9851652.1 adenylyltransferase/cytidyltransferase family protein [Candidatus Paceibacterota bacterium]
MQDKKIKIFNILDRGVHEEDRIIKDYEKLEQIVHMFKIEEKNVVFVQGTFDLYHVGHAKYLEKAKAFGDLLVVAVDTDEFVKLRKGPTRPIVDLEERLAILVRDRSVDILTVLHSKDSADELIKKIKPDVLVLSVTTRDKPNFIEDMKKKLGDSVGTIEVLEPQAETSTSARVRFLALDGASELSLKMKKVIDEHFEMNGQIHKEEVPNEK